MNFPWDWTVFQELGPDGTSTYLSGLISGAQWTVASALIATAIALLLGVAVGVMRTLPSNTCRLIASSYVEVFRDIPLLVQMFVWFFVVPELLPADLGNWIKSLASGPFITASVSLGFYAAARVAEQVRATINSLPPGQLAAGLAMGLNRRQTYQLVILPQAIRVGLPPLTSELINIVKNTSVGMTIGLMELTGRAREMQEMSFHTFEAFAAATVGYLIINGIVIAVMRWVDRGLNAPKAASAKNTFTQEVAP